VLDRSTVVVPAPSPQRCHDSPHVLEPEPDDTIRWFGAIRGQGEDAERDVGGPSGPIYINVEELTLIQCDIEAVD